MTITPEEQERLSRIATVTCGLYAWLPGEAHPVQHAGSGVLIAPGLAMTAKHVTEDMERLDRRYDPARPRGTGFMPEYGTMLYQVPRFGQEPRWATTINWLSRDTDITVMRVVPDSNCAVAVENTILPRAYYDWILCPPPVGARVQLYGFPLPAIANEGNQHRGAIQFVEQDGIVEEVFEPIRTHGMLEFPCYRLSKPVDHAFSGGPVFYDGALVGIVSAGATYDNRAWVASLWPLALLTMQEAGTTRAMTDLFDDGTIRVRDWPALRGSIVRLGCDEALAGAGITARCDHTHPVRR